MSDKPKFELLSQPTTPSPEARLNMNDASAERLAEINKKPSYRAQYENTRESIIDARRKQEDDVLELDRQ